MTASLRVLLCADGPYLGTMLADVLRAKGHDVYEASSGEAALNLALQTPLDVAFIDTALPDMSGLDVGRRIREAKLAQRVRLVALADHSSTEQIGKSRVFGFDLLLLKPVKMEQLLTALALARRLM